MNTTKEEKTYDSNLGKYIIKGTHTKENRNLIKSVKYKEHSEIPVADNFKDFIIDLNNKVWLLDNEISMLTEERRKRIEEYQKIKKQFDSFINNLDVEYETEETEYTYFEDLVHKKALIQ